MVACGPTFARMDASAAVMAIAAAMVVEPGGARVEGEPVAVDVAESLSVAVMVTTPAVIVTPSTDASADAECTVSASAAAADTVPAGVLGSGALPGPLPPLPPGSAPPEVGAAPFAKARASVTWAVGVGWLPLPGAPVAEADAVVDVDEAPVAPNVALPAAVTSRWVVASTVCVAKVSAIAMPTAAPAALTSPVAVVVAEAFWSAVAVNEPVSTSGVPVPTTAVVATFEVVMATTGAIAMFGDVAPP
jgi:hypothetical protein